MKKFIVGVPVVTFINCQTKEEITMNYSMDYNKFGDEIILDYAMVVTKNMNKFYLGF